MLRKVLVLAAILFIPTMVIAATLTWEAPTTYTDGTQIATGDVSRIIYTPYYSASPSTGPWTAGPTTEPGVLTATLPDPQVGATGWYTIDATLDGMTSAKAAAVSKTVPFPVPGAPSGLKVQ